METQSRKSSLNELHQSKPLLKRSDIESGIVFNEIKPLQEPLLNIADYLDCIQLNLDG